MSHPRVSVVIPAYNAERYIAQTIESVINQTVTDWELIVVDDGSQDATCAIVEDYCEKDSRITLVRSDRNSGVAAARNKGFSMVHGSWVALLDSDDVWAIDKLETQLCIAEKTDADIVYCSYAITDECGVKVCDDFIVPQTTCFEDLLRARVISCSTAMLSRAIADRYYFPVDRPHEDYVLWLTLLKEGFKAYGTHEVLASYRIHEGSRSSNKLRNAIDIWNVYHDEFGLSFGKSAYLMGVYALSGLRKYKRK